MAPKIVSGGGDFFFFWDGYKIANVVVVVVVTSGDVLGCFIYGIITLLSLDVWRNDTPLQIWKKNTSLPWGLNKLTLPPPPFVYISNELF